MADNSSFDPRHHIAPGTSLHAFIGWSLLLILGPLVIVGSILATMGGALVGWLIAAIFYYSRLRKARARLMGGSLQVSENQFPEIHASAKAIAHAMGVPLPEVFIVEDNHQNAFAIKQGARSYVVLVDDIVHGALATGNPGVLNFIIAHEIAHHALGHTGTLRSLITSHYRPLSRLDEFSCDAVAQALTTDPISSRDALALLLVGPQLFSKVNRRALDEQAAAVSANRHSKRAESGLSHPLLLRRYARLVQLSEGM
jgi:Zn-dependent protease with chaperone function